ncbi:unnamed protein product, partial [marine sediment metagenome]
MVSREQILSAEKLVGNSEVFLDLLDRVSSLAKVNRPVLIIGERGTGKEMIAQRLHYLSNRWEGPMVTINCAAIAPELLTSELFGHERGAFTGAMFSREGKFELADHGTLFLDEISSSSLEFQEQVLRVIEYNKFQRVGGTRTIEVDTRIIAATNENLFALADQGDFKQDLLDRLTFAVIQVPPLRMRKEDIPVLANHFGAKMLIEMGISELP